MRSSALNALAASPRRVLQEPTSVVGVRFADGRLYLAMKDGREIGAPIALFPRLANATLEQQQNWRTTGRGLGVHWPDVDEDIHVAHLLGMSD
jgi:hypothetical protein